MTFAEFKAAIECALKRSSTGRTWKELKADLALPYDRPCPEWTKRLEQQIGLVRRKGIGRKLVWSVGKK
jgi:hypothetical protein